MASNPVDTAGKMIILMALDLAAARKAHEEAKSDPTRNVGTGQAAYAFQRNFETVLDSFARSQPQILEALREKTQAIP